MNNKRIRRLWREEGLRVPYRKRKRPLRGIGVAERWVRTVREDCLDHLLVLSRRHLETILAEYVEHYNRARPHRGLDLTPPCQSTVAGGMKVIRRDVLDGFIHEYALAA